MLQIHGSEEQKARFLPALVRGEELWCQFFSEPGSGSDLASAQTRAVHDGGGWTVNGQKVWTSGAQYADRGMLLARTDREVPKHRGLSFFVIDVGQPGIEVRPLHQMNGQHGFNEVFFTDAHIDEDRLITEEGSGWSVAVTVLMYERFSTALPSAMPGRKAGQLDERPGAAATRVAEARTTGRTGVSELVIDVAKELGEVTDPVMRQKLAALWAQEAANGYLTRAGQSAREGRRPSAAARSPSWPAPSWPGPAGRPGWPCSARRGCSTRRIRRAAGRSSSGRCPVPRPRSPAARMRSSGASSASGCSGCPRSRGRTGTSRSRT